MKKPKHDLRGRPTAYDPKYCQMVVEFLAQGYSLAAFAGHILVTYDTILEWVKTHREFSSAKRIGEGLREKLMIEDGRALLKGEVRGDSKVWAFMMKNLCNWTDRTDLRISSLEETDNEDGKLLRSIPRDKLIALAKKDAA
jgi:hypothetical protein